MDILNYRIENYDKGNIMPIAFQTLLDNTKDMMFVKDINLVYVAASMPFAKMVGKSSVEDIIGKTDFEIFAGKSFRRGICLCRKSAGKRSLHFRNPPACKRADVPVLRRTEYPDAQSWIVDMMALINEFLEKQ